MGTIDKESCELCSGNGYIHSNNQKGGDETQKCDECNIFNNDLEAQSFYTNNKPFKVNIMEKQAYQVNNYRQIKVKYIGRTSHKGSKIKIYEPKRYNTDKTESKSFSYCSETGDIMEQAYKILIDNGFKVIARASDNENYIFLCDNWSEDFKKVSELTND